MYDDLEARFAALTPVGKARVLAALIHMETIHVRSIHLDDPSDSKRIYAASEFMHRLAGLILGVLSPGKGGGEAMGVVLETIAPRGSGGLADLAKWIAQES